MIKKTKALEHYTNATKLRNKAFVSFGVVFGCIYYQFISIIMIIYESSHQIIFGPFTIFFLAIIFAALFIQKRKPDAFSLRFFITKGSWLSIGINIVCLFLLYMLDGGFISLIVCIIWAAFYGAWMSTFLVSKFL